MMYPKFTQFLTESSTVRLLKQVEDRNFGIINGGSSPADSKNLRVLLNNAGYNLLWIEGQFHVPSEKEDEEPTTTQDLSYVVIAPKAETDPDDLRKILFRLAEKFGYPNFLLKPLDKSKLFVIGAAEEKWPGRKVTRPFAEYTGPRFPAIMKRYKGEKYEFLTLVEDRDVQRDDTSK